MRSTTARATARWGVVLGTLALTIGLAACGSSSGNNSAATTVTSSATTTAADEPTPTSGPPVPADVTGGSATIDVKVGTDDFTTTKGTRVVSVPEGTSVTINITSADAEDYHLHGYDIEQKADAGETATIRSRPTGPVSSISRATSPRTRSSCSS